MENEFDFLASAAQIAAEAGQDALMARRHRDIARMKAFVLDAWRRIMTNANPLKATIIALVLVLLNLCTSWEMNWDLLDQTGVFKTFGWLKPPSWSPLIIALPLEALAFWVASWLGKAYYHDIFEWHVWNRQHIVYNGQYLRALAVSDEEKHRQKSRFWFWLLLFLLVVAQGGIALHRIHVVKSNPVGILLAVLSFVFLLGEVMAGVYLDFQLKLWRVLRDYRRHSGEFRIYMNRCGSNDRVVFQTLEKARAQQVEPELNGDMKRAIFRHKYRSLDSEDYVDEVLVKQTTVVVTGTDNAPARDVRVIGFLPGGGSTDACFTNVSGSTILYWDSREDALVSIRLNDVEIPGPFSKEQVHRLRLSLPQGLRPVALNQ